MTRVERILCPTDLSTELDEVLRYGVAFARADGAKLILLHCSESDSLPEEHNGEKMKSHMNRLFVESLVPHLGLASMNRVLREAPCPVLVAGQRKFNSSSQN